MSDWFAASLAWQRQLLDAQRATLAAGDTLVRMQDAGHKVAQANLAAWNAWASLWGIGR